MSHFHSRTCSASSREAVTAGRRTSCTGRAFTRSILDINSTVRPDFAIVDGILGMEGNGPIQGDPKPCGILVAGDDPVAVNATCARIMGLVPERIDYLAHAGLLLGHLQRENIRQLAEPPESVQTSFAVLDTFKHLRVEHAHS